MHTTLAHLLVHNFEHTRPDIHAQATRHIQVYAWNIRLQSFCLWTLQTAFLPSIYILCTAHMHVNTHPPFSQHTARTRTPKSQTYSRTHKHVPINTCASPIIPTTPSHSDASTCEHACLPSPPQALTVGPVFTQTGRAGVVSTSLLSLTCSTCPLAPASAGLNARVCLARSPEPQSRSSCPVRVRLPEPGRGACHQESSPRGDPALTVLRSATAWVSTRHALPSPFFSSSESWTYGRFQAFPKLQERVELKEIAT